MYNNLNKTDFLHGETHENLGTSKNTCNLQAKIPATASNTIMTSRVNLLANSKYIILYPAAEVTRNLRALLRVPGTFGCILREKKT